MTTRRGRAPSRGPNPATHVVAVDIGNSAAKWSIRGVAAKSGDERRVSVRDSRWAARFVDGVDAEIAGAGPIRFHAASVNVPALQRLHRRLRTLGRGDELRVITGADCPMTTRLPNPSRLGIDRLLAAWRASRVAPGKWCVVIDAGSAITVDCAHPDGVFLGGAILPGIALQFESLGRGTDALPTLDHLDGGSSWPDVSVPATTTDTAIRAGVWLGTAAAIDGMIDRTLAGVKLSSKTSASRSKYEVFLTGGDAERLSPLLSHPHHLHANLVLEALLDESLDRATTAVDA